MSRAATFLGTAELNYAGSPAYCSTPCLTGTYTTAGTVTVTVVGNDLQFDVDLASGFIFQNNHNTSFAFGLDVAGATISNIVSTPGGTWTTQTNVNPGDGVGNNNPPGPLWPYGLTVNTAGSSNDLEFLVSDGSTALTLNDIIQTQDKNGHSLWFLADVGNPLGNTGYVGADSSQGTAPLPGGLVLLGSALGGAGLVRGWRKRRKPLRAGLSN
jgi:hypothetical protein